MPQEALPPGEIVSKSSRIIPVNVPGGCGRVIKNKLSESDKEKLKLLLPIKSVYTFYTEPKISWKNPLNDDEKEVSISLPLYDKKKTPDEIESMRINPNRSINE